MSHFYPKCYNINSSRIANENKGEEGIGNDIDDFKEQFRYVYASGVLKKYVQGNKN